MSKYTIEQIRKVVLMSNVYCSAKDMEGIRIDYTDEDHFIGTGEDSFDEVMVYFEDIDLDADTFYRLQPVDIKTVFQMSEEK